MAHRCSVAGCERPPAARGLCKPHYGARRRRGLLPTAKACSLPGCGAPHEARGYCRAHYLRLAAPERSACSARGCGRPASTKGLCAKHYGRLRSGGTLLTWREHFLREHPPAGGVGLVPLRNGRVAVVDAEDYPRVVVHRWYTNRAGGREFACTDFGGRQVALTHFVLGLPKGKRVLFLDKDSFNCRRSNLRVVTQQQLTFNQRVQRRRGKSSRYKGVSRRADTGRYAAYVDRDGRRHRLGTFASERDAAAAYDEKARELFGPLARLNFPDPAPPPP